MSELITRWWRCDNCGKFRRPEEMVQGEIPVMDLGGHVDLNEYQVCKEGFGCAADPGVHQ